MHKIVQNMSAWQSLDQFISSMLNCLIWPVQLQMFVIGQGKSDSLDLKQPIKP